MFKRSIIIDPQKDNVACLLEPAQKGDTIQTPNGEITLREDVDFAHKVNITDLAKGQPVYKYGVEIGYMLVDAPCGTWIHNHNMGCDRGKK